ncbi:molybdate ABC transporter substrate-binding protein [Actinotalea sp. M2MS4P-6]|uniref:molybdate ABC transporter substrate-binding protein n=1 Tax=Actinotalea sp. M2MS4P-6 TaxID=2983762 RepID=UPI0021E49886|nr:molybdate ABC transporter substrate-binding protein [Actinotalea sp. M2MS4P-6]MCV2393786.1 molybdate ABC transporter substrate-binding protein [Actinotalea sp. M2MS4P-6]
MTRRSTIPAALGLAAIAALAACSPAGPNDTVTVLAAASLTDVFTELAEDFEAGHPGVDVQLSLAGSSTLAAQVVAGAPADVLATASAATMQTVLDADAATASTVFARNTLMIAVPPGNPGHVRGPADLADPGLSIALCAPEVPCGAAALDTFEAIGVDPAPDTLEPDVRAVLTKVELGEVDAGVVYRTDVRAAGDRVEGVALPGAVSTDYDLAVLTEAPHPELGAQFVALVLSPTGADALARAGFLAP